MFSISLKLSSCTYANESSGIKTSDVLTLNHSHKIPKKAHVISNLGAEIHPLLLLATSNFVPLLEDISPKVSMEMRRMRAERSSSNTAKM